MRSNFKYKCPPPPPRVETLAYIVETRYDGTYNLKVEVIMKQKLTHALHFIQPGQKYCLEHHRTQTVSLFLKFIILQDYNPYLSINVLFEIAQKFVICHFFLIQTKNMSVV